MSARRPDPDAELTWLVRVLDAGTITDAWFATEAEAREHARTVAAAGDASVVHVLRLEWVYRGD